MSKKTVTELRVRYGETDQMGVVYYGNYAAYLEQGRTDWLRAQGFSYKWMEANGVQLPVVKLSIDYKRPAHYDEVIRITTKLRNIPTYKIEFDYEIHNQDNQLLVSAYTALVFVDMETKKLMKAPDYLDQKLREE
ncbi:acyl-CoA thioesterase [Aureitalea marina]|uniref:acyl-CoA thioesterase n=1 Tax=Aureitalea marina TaxID=930804 RepID=UPI0024830C2F|nr:thioesterase family protein [Aureitalea marina]